MTPTIKLHAVSRQDFAWAGWLSLVSVLFAGGLALFSLWAWWGGDWKLAAYGDTVPMAPSTAVLLVLLSVALGLHLRWVAKPVERIFESLVAGITTATALAVVIQELIGSDLRWEQWLGRTDATVRGIPVGQMSPFTAVAFLLAAFSLLLLLPPLAGRRWPRWLSTAAALLGGGFCLVTALAYVSGTPLFYGGGVVPMAFSTALALAALNFALLLTGGVGRALSAWWTPARGTPMPESEHSLWQRSFLLAATLASTLALAGFYYLQSAQTAARAAAQGELNAIANLKAEQISQWREERLGEARFLLRTPAVAVDVAALLAHPADPAAQANVLGWLEPIKGAERYESVALFDANLHLLLATPASARPGITTSREQLAATLSHPEALLSDIQREKDGTLHLDLLAPILSPPAPGQVAPRESSPLIAVIQLRLNPDRYLFQLLQSWPTPSATAESLLVRREGAEIVFLNELRHRRGTALLLRRSVHEQSLPAAKGLRGETNVQEGRDYRGVAVLATTRVIPDSPWVLVAKVDRTEIYAPMLRQAWMTGTLVLVLLLAVMLGAAVAWRQRYTTYLDRALVSERERNALAQRLDLVMQHANDIILLMDENGRILEANARALSTYGYTLDELRQLPPGGLRPPSATENLARQLELFELPKGGVFETVHRCKNGATFPVEVSGQSVVIEHRRYKSGIFRDITQRKEHEAQIDRLTRLYAALSEVNQTIIRTKSRDQLFADICRVLVEFGGFKMAWIGWRDPTSEAIVPVEKFGDHGDYLSGIRIFADDRPEGHGITGTAIRENRTCVCNDIPNDPRMAPWREAAERNGFSSNFALPIRVAGRTVGALTVYAAEPGFFGDKEVALLEEAANDISFALENIETEARRKQTEEQLTLLHAGLEAAPNSIVITDEHGIIEWVNPAFTRDTGYSFTEAVGQSPRLLKSGRQSDAFYAEMWQTIAEGRNWQGEVINQRKDGSHYIEDMTIAPVRDATGQIRHYIALKLDITARKEAERRIHEQAQYLDKAAEAIVVTDLDQRITFWSRGAERLFGYTSAAMIGQALEEVFKLPSVGGSTGILEGVATTGQWRGEIQGFNRQGQPLDIETSITLIRDDTGRATARLSISTDITEKKKLQEQYMRAQRLESIGMLAAGIAHDLNNVLAPILMAVALLRDHAADARDLRLLDTLEKSAGRGAGLVRQILGFAHGIGGELQSMQAKHFLRDIVEVIEATFPKSIRLEHDIPSDLWPILANPTQIHQVMLNLCVNARDAMPAGGTLRLRAENCVLDKIAASRLDGATPGSWLVLHVEDTGCGIAPENISRIWEAFYTTKSADKGTGLGLATVRGIVATHHGFINLESELGRGTTFRVYLPADESAIAKAASATPLPPIRGQNELILIVDDEPSIRNVARSILTKFGYRVVTAEDGVEATALFAAQVAEIPLVITDLDMPNLGGAALAQRIRSINPAVKLLTISGADHEGGSQVQPGAFADAFLMKPFSAEALLTQVHRLLHPEDPPT